MGGYEQCEDSWHSSYPVELFSIFGFRFFRKSFHHLLSIMDLFKPYQSHMMSQKILKLQRSGDLGGYEECKDSSHSSYPCEFFSTFGFGLFRKTFHHLLCVMNLFKQYASHMMSQKVLETPKKWRIGRIRTMWGFLTFFVPLWIFNYFWIWIFSEIISPPSKCNEPI